MPNYQDLLNQYNSLSISPEEVAAEKAARENLTQQQFLGNIGSAATNLGSAIAGASKPADTSFYDKLGKQAEQQYAIGETQREKALKGRTQKFEALKGIADQQRAEGYLKIQQDQEERSKEKFVTQQEMDQYDLAKAKSQSMETEMLTNPNDPYADRWRKEYSKKYPDLAPHLANASVNQMKQLVDYKDKTEGEKFDRQLKQDTLNVARETKNATLELKRSIDEAKTKRDEEKAQAKRDELLDKKVTKYKDDLQKTSIPALTSAIQQVQEVLPPKGDVPGYGRVVGALPDAVVSRQGEQLRERVATLFNITLKDRSGAAVTDPELARLQKEFGAGKWKDDKSIRDGINSYIKRLQEVSKNITGGTPPEVIEKYQEQGGSNYEKLLDDYRAKSETNKPKTVIQNGHTYQLNPSTGKYE